MNDLVNDSPLGAFEDEEDDNLLLAFIEEARNGKRSKEEIMDKYELVGDGIEFFEMDFLRVERAFNELKKRQDLNDKSAYANLEAEVGSFEEVKNEYESSQKQLQELKIIYKQLEELKNKVKNFNKYNCFSNIRTLLKRNPDIKISQIEKEAGVSPGYMSRLEKDDSTSEPSVEFLVSAAKLLNVSLDELALRKIVLLTPTEQYLSDFFKKLIKDTQTDILDWNRETEFELSKLEEDCYDRVNHPLFSFENIGAGLDNQQKNYQVVFCSKTFGPNTLIDDVCFNLKFRDGSILYLMNIKSSANHVVRNAREAWFYVPDNEANLLLASSDGSPIVEVLDELFSVVKECFEHPRINKNIRNSIDSYMKNYAFDLDELLK